MFGIQGGEILLYSMDVAICILVRGKNTLFQTKSNNNLPAPSGQRHRPFPLFNSFPRLHSFKRLSINMIGILIFSGFQ